MRLILKERSRVFLIISLPFHKEDETTSCGTQIPLSELSFIYSTGGTFLLFRIKSLSVA